jgi:hypothetical protein
MRSWVGLVGLVVIVLAGAAASASAAATSGDSVSGSSGACFWWTPVDPTLCGQDFDFSAHVVSGPGGESPSGDLVWSVGGLTPGGSSYSEAAPSCLYVHGRVAIIGVSGNEGRGGISGGEYPFFGLVRVTDGGGPGSRADMVEIAIQRGAKSGPPLAGPTSCSTFPGGFPSGGYYAPDASNETGDLVVADRPASKEDCKHGNWTTFRVFKNQGDCVSFVAATGKKRP